VLYEGKGYGQGDNFFDARDKNGGLLPAGKYIYVLTVITTSGEQQLKGLVYINY